MDCKISIIITFFKGELFLPILLDSLVKSFEKSERRLYPELILVVDSPDTDVEELQRLVLNLPLLNVLLEVNDINLGVSKSRDIGISLSSGDFITFIDQDDNVEVSYFSTLELYINRNVDLFVQNGYVKNIISNKKVPIFYFRPNIKLSSFILNNKILTPSLIVVNKKIIDKYKIHFTLPFDKYKGIDDWFFILQILTKVDDLKYSWIRNKNVNYCIHNNNYSNDLQEPINGSIEVLKHITVDSAYLLNIIKSRIEVLEFLKLFYSKDRMNGILQNPIIFCKFIFQYLQDVNRIVRFMHRKFLGLKIRHN